MTQQTPDEPKSMQEQYPLTELSDIDLGLAERLSDPEFRREWFRAELEDDVPATYKALRERRGMTQAGLAQQVGTKQSGISRFEQSDEAVWEFQFLLRMAEALDARLRLVVEASEDVIAEYEEEPIEAHALVSFELKPLEQQQSAPPALSELGNQNGSREHRSVPGSLARSSESGEGVPLHFGRSQRGGQAVQLSALSAAATVSGDGA